MKTLLCTLLAAQLLAGCTLWGETRTKSFEAQDVTDENSVSFGSVTVAVNPDLKYQNVSGAVNVAIQGQSGGPTKRKFHVFARPGMANLVVVETHSRKISNPFQQPQDQDLTKNMKAIQKGRKRIDGKTWDVYIRALPEFPEQILSAAKQKGVHLKKYDCGLEIGARRLINSQERIYVSYIKGFDKCEELPLNNSILNDEQTRMIRDFTSQFEANVTITENSGD